MVQQYFEIIGHFPINDELLVILMIYLSINYEGYKLLVILNVLFKVLVRIIIIINLLTVIDMESIQGKVWNELP